MVRGAVANAVASEGKDLREARLPYGDMTVPDFRCVLPRHRAGFAERWECKRPLSLQLKEDRMWTSL